MSDPPARRAPPGWYSEQGQHGFRYWDGESWAEPRGGTLGFPVAMGGRGASPIHQRVGLAFMGAAVALLIAGLLLPWTEADTGKQGVVDADIPWLVSPGSVADSWLLILLVSLMVWALGMVTMGGFSPRVWLTALVGGLVIMGFCVAEGLAFDNDLDSKGAEVGLGLFLAYAGGASSAVGGVLLRPSR